jgi:hypothetical protein
MKPSEPDEELEDEELEDEEDESDSLAAGDWDESDDISSMSQSRAILDICSRSFTTCRIS